MRISYAITVCNELEEIKRLLNFLKDKIRPEDEIVILFDSKNGTKEVEDYLFTVNIQLYKGEFDGNFGEWKNKLNSYCTGEYTFNIDSDEIPHESLINNLPQMLEWNNNVDLFFVPRINTVEGITEEHIRKWNWVVNENNWLNFPDIQARIYRNNLDIKWEGKVHEHLVGFELYTILPFDEEYSLYHPKDIVRQEKQNELYDELLKDGTRST